MTGQMSVLVKGTDRNELNFVLAVATAASVSGVSPVIEEVTRGNFSVTFSPEQGVWVQSFTTVLERLKIEYTFDEPPAMSA